jgi:selenocysteine lyase/cysteine desulfurase
MKRVISALSRCSGEGSHRGCWPPALGIGVFSPTVDWTALRAEFPVLARRAYLNAGTDGPLPARAARAAAVELTREAGEGRAMSHFMRRFELASRLRASYAAALGCDAADVALTSCTSEGIAHTVGGLELGAGDEILTSDEEHPGMLGALGAARELSGVSVRAVPLARIADSVGPRTRLVACCHVGWVSGSLVPAELAGLDVPVLLDGAQGAGAIAVDVHALGCDAYAGAGQKWLCGPDGTGMLYVSAELRERLRVSRRGYVNLLDPGEGLEAGLHPDARRFDSPALSAEALACAVSAVELLEEAGWDAVHERARALSGRLVERVAERGREVAPRDDTTLVSFASPDPPAERDRLLQAGCIVRDIPRRPWLRASVGAWNDDGDLERLVSALSP